MSMGGLLKRQLTQQLSFSNLTDLERGPSSLNGRLGLRPSTCAPRRVRACFPRPLEASEFQSVIRDRTVGRLAEYRSGT